MYGMTEHREIDVTTNLGDVALATDFIKQAIGYLDTGRFTLVYPEGAEAAGVVGVLCYLAAACVAALSVQLPGEMTALETLDFVVETLTPDTGLRLVTDSPNTHPPAQ